MSSGYSVSPHERPHAIGHTRMATESAVYHQRPIRFRPARSVPRPQRVAVESQRRPPHAAARGHDISTENDSEVAAGYLTWRMSQGASLRDSLSSSLNDLDGFFTFVVAREMALPS